MNTNLFSLPEIPIDYNFGTLNEGDAIEMCSGKKMGNFYIN